MGHAEGGEHRIRFPAAFVVFGGRIGLRYHAAPSLEIADAVLGHERPDRDGSVGGAAVGEVADRASIDPPALGFQFIDDLHRADLGGAGQRSGGEGRAEGIERVRVGAEFSPHPGHDVHHVRVPLDAHEVLDLDPAVAGDPADIVSGQIHEHHVLRAFLLVGEEFSGQGYIFFGSAPARPGAGDRAGLDRAALGTGHHFRGRSRDHQPVKVEVIHVRRRVHHPERPVEVEGVDGERRLEALGRDDLDDVPGGHVVLGLAHHLEIPLPAGIGHRLGKRPASRTAPRKAQSVGERRADFADGCLDLCLGGVVGLVGQARVGNAGVYHHLDHVAGAVEDQHAVGQQEHRIGKTQRVLDAFRETLEATYRVVGQIADETAVEGGQTLDVRGDHVLKYVPERRQGIRALGGFGPAVAQIAALDLVSPALDNDSRPRSQKRIAGDALAAFDRFHQERRAAVPYPEEGGHRGVAVGEDFPPDRNQVRLFRERAEVGTGREVQGATTEGGGILVGPPTPGAPVFRPASRP